MTNVSPAQKAVARAAANAFGGIPIVQRYYDREESHWVDVLICRDRPVPGLSTYSTVTLHAALNDLDGKVVRVEFAGVAPNSLGSYPGMLATAAFNVLKDSWLAAPGVVFPSIVKDYDLSTTLDHIFWAPPIPWPQLGSFTIDEESTVQWLLAVPISESERRFVFDHGFDQTEALFAQHEIEYFDLERSPVV
jgi:antitoxin YqcF